MRINRRDLFKLGLGAAATAGLSSRVRFAQALAAADATTLSRTIVKGTLLGSGAVGSYFRLADGPGEPHILRSELATRTATPVRRSILNLAHLTDIHLIDAQSPARVEWLDRFNEGSCASMPFSSAFRAQESLTLHVLEAMIRQLRTVGVSPVTGAPLALAMCTGDNIDNEQLNELRWFIDLMDGGARVAANSGGPSYEGVQAAAWGDQEYWHPDPLVPDRFKRRYGFPEYPGLLDDALVAFDATGIGVPWFQTFGNHDGLMQGNVPRNPLFDAAATGPLKVSGPPPGVDPCDAFDILRNDPAAALAAPARIVTADANRRILRRSEYVEEMFRTTGMPIGHGFTDTNRTDGTAYYHADAGPVRMIALDTVNPGGYAEGSIGRAQFEWLLARLAEAHSSYLDTSGDVISTTNQDRLVVLFSHHGLRSLSNPLAMPDPLEPGSNDLPRVLADEIEAALHRFPNVIAWVNGHTHENVVEARPGASGGFWDIGTAAHVDWSCQSRLVEIVDNGDGTLSIFGTMIDHAAPVVPGGVDPVLRLASISRELAANDPQYGFAGPGPGGVDDRNVELVIRAPFALP